MFDIRVYELAVLSRLLDIYYYLYNAIRKLLSACIFLTSYVNS